MELAATLTKIDLLGVEVNPGYHHVASADKTGFSSTIGFDIEEPHHGDEMLTCVWYLGKAVINFELLSLFVNGQSPLRYLDSLPESSVS